jgi:hypothetical protein
VQQIKLWRLACASNEIKLDLRSGIPIENRYMKSHYGQLRRIIYCSAMKRRLFRRECYARGLEFRLVKEMLMKLIHSVPTKYCGTAPQNAETED